MITSRVLAAVFAAGVALGAGTYVVAQTTEPPVPPPLLPSFSADLCGSYLEKAPIQIRQAVRRDLEPLRLKGAYRECIVRAVAFLGSEVVEQCLLNGFDPEDQTGWEDAIAQAFIQCAPGPVPPPPPPVEPPPVVPPPAS